MSKDKKENSNKQEEGEVKQLTPAPQQNADQPEAPARFIGHVVKLKNRAEEVIYYGKGLFTVVLHAYYLEATDSRNGVITRLPYSNIDFMKEVPA